MKTLDLRWQRLVTTEGATCDRCGATEAAVEHACTELQTALQPLGIAVRLEKIEIAPEAFAGEPAESNRIWIAGRPLEDWVGGHAGSSPCCAACGDADCRTLEVDGEVHEAIPERLILQAAFTALPTLVDEGAPSAAAAADPPGR
ncbi:DUF2703 domain-containing protein [Azoarcus olearius]|nr:DUF2703 domain-containing protein [Azoarcus olearius]